MSQQIGAAAPGFLRDGTALSCARGMNIVEVSGFEPPISASRTQRSNQVEPHLESSSHRRELNPRRAAYETAAYPVVGARAWSPGLSPSCAFASFSCSPSTRPRPHSRPSENRTPLIGLGNQSDPRSRPMRAPRRICTSGPSVRSRMLCLLSYGGRNFSRRVRESNPRFRFEGPASWATGRTRHRTRGRNRTCGIRLVEATLCF